MIESLVKIILCHLVGDYVLQSDYLAMNKGKDWYILFVHSALYCVPFILTFGLDMAILFLFIVHFIVDACKARYNIMDIVADQYLHYFAAICVYAFTQF